MLLSVTARRHGYSVRTTREHGPSRRPPCSRVSKMTPRVHGLYWQAVLTAREHGYIVYRAPVSTTLPCRAFCEHGRWTRVLSVHTTRVYGPCRQAVFTGGVDRRPWTRPANTG